MKSLSKETNFKGIREYIANWLRNIIHLVLPNNDDVAEQTKFPDLAPVTSDNYAHNIDMLNSYLRRPARVKGIAITGPYSSGKSTFLNTFKQRYPEYKLIFVSLASFQTKPKPTTEELEHAILKQLLYRESNTDMRGSRFTRIPLKQPSRISQLITGATITIWLVLAGLTYNNWDIVKQPWFVNQLSEQSTSPLLILLSGFMGAVPVLLLADGLRLFQRLKISKINPINGEIELQSNEVSSVFRLHLEEILAYFHHSGAHAVVFEDFDRFEGTLLFERLRELNKLINDSKFVAQDVRFIYALRDDVFVHNDRTKFFDAIVPVLPIVSEANAHSTFKQMLKKAGILSEIDCKRWDHLCRIITLHIQDMRILKSIISEFKLYNQVLALPETKESKRKLLAFIAYKNLYSDDFALCQAGKGELATLIQHKSTFLRQKKKQLEANIRALRDAEAEAEEECLHDKQELAELFVYRLAMTSQYTNAHPNYLPLRSLCGISLQSVEANVAIERLLELRSNSRVQIQSCNNQSTNLSLTQNALRETFVHEYKQRLQYLEKREESARHRREESVKSLRLEVASLKLLTLPECLESSSTEFNSCKNKPLVLALIKQGFIDEEYSLYFSKHVEGELTSQDMAFIHALIGQDDFNADYRASNYQSVSQYLSGRVFSAPSSYNIGLIEYLSKQSGEDEPTYFKTCIQKQFISHSEGLARLLQIDWTKGCLQGIIAFWPTLLKQLAGSKALSNYERVSLLLKVLPYIEEITLSSKHVNDIVASYPETLELLSSITDKNLFLRTFALCGVRIGNVRNLPTQYPVIRNALEHGILALNSETLTTACSAINGERPLAKPFDAGDPSGPISKLSEFIYSDRAVLAQLLINKSIINFPEEGIINLLNMPSDGGLNEGSKSVLINSVEFEVTKVKKLELHHCQIEELLKAKRIKSNWTNLISLIKHHNALDEREENEPIELTKAISTALSDETFFRDLGDDLTSLPNDGDELVVEFIEAHLFSAQRFADYIAMLNYKYSCEAAVLLSHEQVELLVKNSLLEPSVDMFNHLISNNYVDAAFSLIEANPDVYFTDDEDKVVTVWPENLEYQLEHFSKIFDNKSIPRQVKVSMIEENQSFLLDYAKPKHWIELVLPKISWSTIELAKLGTTKELPPQLVKALCLDIKMLELDRETLATLLERADVSNKDKIKLIIGQAPFLLDDLWNTLRKWSNRPNTLAIELDGRLSRFMQDTIENRTLCCALTHLGLISSFSQHGSDRLRVNHKRKRVAV